MAALDLLDEMLAELDCRLPGEQPSAVPEAPTPRTTNGAAVVNGHSASTKPISYMKGPSYTVTRDIEVLPAAVLPPKRRRHQRHDRHGLDRKYTDGGTILSIPQKPTHCARGGRTRKAIVVDASQSFSCAKHVAAWSGCPHSLGCRPRAGAVRAGEREAAHERLHSRCESLMSPALHAGYVCVYV